MKLSGGGGVKKLVGLCVSDHRREGCLRSWYVLPRHHTADAMYVSTPLLLVNGWRSLGWARLKRKDWVLVDFQRDSNSSHSNRTGTTLDAVCSSVRACFPLAVMYSVVVGTNARSIPDDVPLDFVTAHHVSQLHPPASFQNCSEPPGGPHNPESSFSNPVA